MVVVAPKMSAWGIHVSTILVGLLCGSYHNERFNKIYDLKKNI